MKSLAIIITVSVLIASSFAQVTNGTKGCNSTNCVACDSTNTNCTSCGTSNFLLGLSSTDGTVYCVDPVGTLNCPSDTNTTASGCASCNSSSGFYANDAGYNLTGCAPCSTLNCGSCSANYSVCTGCNTGYFFIASSATCLAASTLNCSTTNATGCATCNSGAFGFATNWTGTGLTACLACSDINCGICQANYSACTSCNTNFLVNTINYTCVNASVLNCSGTTAPNGCTSCPTGAFGLATNWTGTGLTACLACSDLNCGTCSVNYSACTTCNINYFLNANNATCLATSTLNCNTTNATGCATCNTGPYGLASNWSNTGLTACLACSDVNCGTCSASYNLCTSCNANFLNVTNGTCLNISNLTCNASANSTNSSGCTSCPAGAFGFAPNWFQTGLTACIPCGVGNCNNCLNNFAVCSPQGCAPGFFLPLINSSNATSGINNAFCQSASALNLTCNTTADGQGCGSCFLGTGLMNLTLSNQTNSTVYNNCSSCTQGNCSNCNNNFASCSVCQPTYAVFNVSSVGNCVSCATLNCPAVNSSCSSGEGCVNCNNGDFLAPSTVYSGPNTCSACPSSCASCSSLSVCTACKSGLNLKIASNTTTNVTVICTSGSERVIFGLVSMVFAMIYMLF